MFETLSPAPELPRYRKLAGTRPTQNNIKKRVSLRINPNPSIETHEVILSKPPATAIPAKPSPYKDSYTPKPPQNNLERSEAQRPQLVNSQEPDA